jgi:hypothetical protein
MWAAQVHWVSATWATNDPQGDCQGNGFTQAASGPILPFLPPPSRAALALRCQRSCYTSRRAARCHVPCLDLVDDLERQLSRHLVVTRSVVICLPQVGTAQEVLILHVNVTLCLANQLNVCVVDGRVDDLPSGVKQHVMFCACTTTGVACP